MNKYRNQKVYLYGMEFDSKKEAFRYDHLLHLQSKGQISNLERQVRYELIPEQREKESELYKSGAKKGKPKKPKLIERPTYYIADFVYKDSNGKWVVEDVKGIQTEVFKIKKKLMLYLYGIRIKIV